MLEYNTAHLLTAELSCMSFLCLILIEMGLMFFYNLMMLLFVRLMNVKTLLYAL